MTLSQILRISRPRFWIYELGTYALGMLAGLTVGGAWSWVYGVLYGLFFLIPANILIYGINDVFDYETDKRNPKKVEYEDLLHPSLHKKVFAYIFWSNIGFVILGLFVPWKAFIALIFFYFFATFYSAPPIRAKARPFLDSFFSAGHYVVTGVFGYYLSGAQGGVILPVCAGMCWAIAMHAYSAVPDIDADKQSGIQTIAISLGKKTTILVCAFLYVCAGVLLVPYFSWLPLLLTVPYVILMYKSYVSDEQKLFRLYTYFPKLNALVGMILFFLVLWRGI